MRARRIWTIAVTRCAALLAASGCNEPDPSTAIGGGGLSGSAGGGAAPGGSGGAVSGAGGRAIGAGGVNFNPAQPDAGAAGSANEPAGDPYVFTGSTDGMLRAFRLNESDGSLLPAGSIQTPDGLDFVALAEDDRTFFVVRDSAIATYGYDRAVQSFTPGSNGATAGRGTFVAVSPAGRSVFVAHYTEGRLSLLPYASGSGFGTLTTLTPGENAHQVRVGPSGRHVYVPCLGSDHLALYDFDPGLGTLTPAQPATVTALGGPRHIDFHPSAPIVYVLTEISSQLHVYDLDIQTGALSLRAGDSLYTSEDEEYHWSSDVHVTPDARFLYATNRDPPEIVVFSVAADGSLRRLGAEPLDAVVRAFALAPSGRYLHAGDEDGQLIAFRIDATTGALARASSTLGLGNIHTTIVRHLQ